ncbi:peptidase S8 and S53 subtilisin kexin sedolisin [Kribbella flavida DSM 17836]|uniref:Peptidase S8 and S53 subtilisin kexin sedolisin n=1 Tax=Kribbella flavida (strain DSM 17836 / JCM 10339 / NBRC 14399) TaxID=479435 RepID=D2PYN6_KRIFD|nr:type VII secretion-associated serine protease mycosin [Kribbella flavida]ADB29882.1 peptidase S8 and S53 subtilisin kexin sedolisin [Kribbella flavida DSM 17836]
MSARRFVCTLAAGALAAGWPAIAAAPAAAAPPRGACTNPEPGRSTESLLPWAQQLLKPQRAWPFSTGSGVTVAVVDSGVDADHPQLRRPGKVLRGRDFHLVGSLPGNYDCVSHGTGVAGIIAAGPATGIGFAGVAPGARILPVRISERDSADNGRTELIDPVILAKGIRYAVDQGARVINLSMSGDRDQAPVRQAVEYAVKRDVVVVAAVGNRQQTDGERLPSFPAAYPGVLGVGAIDNAGARLSGSQTGPYVDLVAPGGSVLATVRQHGHAYVDGTSYAAPFVSGAAALVRAAWPKLTARQVVQRLTATASPARGGSDSTQYGAGIIDPYRAVTEGMVGTRMRQVPPMTVPPPDQQRLAAAAWWRSAGVDAQRLTALAVAGALTALLAGWLVVAGRRRRWFAGRTTIGHQQRPDLAELPPEYLFTRQD